MSRRNSWIVFLHDFGGNGWTKSELSAKYKLRATITQRTIKKTTRRASRKPTRKASRKTPRKAPRKTSYIRVYEEENDLPDPEMCKSVKTVGKCGSNPNCTWVKPGRCRGRSGVIAGTTVHQGPMGPPE